MKTRALLLLAAIPLALGLAVYLFDRPSDRIYFVPDWWQPATNSRSLFGPLGAGLPCFAHVLFFILITAAMLAPWRFRILSICLLWFGIDSLFELAQHDAIASRIADILPNWFDRILLLENTRHYLLSGTFDPLDLVAIATGSLVAYVILYIFRSRENNNGLCK